MSEVTRRCASTRRKISATPGSGDLSLRRISTPAQMTSPAVSEALENKAMEPKYRIWCMGGGGRKRVKGKGPVT